MQPLANAKELLEALPRNARVIELAGPTPGGNMFLKTHHIQLAAKPLVTNRENPALFYGMPPYPKTFPVNEVADVRRLPYHDVALFICSYLTWYGDDVYNKNQPFKQFLARLHYKLGYRKSNCNLHIALFRETAKALRPNGLLLVEGLIQADFRIAQKCGFILLYREETDEGVFSAVFQLNK